MERRTSQRDAIRSVFEDAARPLSPGEVLDAARDRVPGLGQATVYRTIKAFLDDGVLSPVTLPGDPARYELHGKDHHHHFHCRRCDKVYEVDHCAVDVKALKPRGFIVDDHELVLYGTCAECR